MNKNQKMKSQQQGWMLFEVMVATIIMMLLLSLIVPILSQAKQHHSIVQQRFQAQAWIEGFKDNLVAQWGKMFWKGCGNWPGHTITISPYDSVNLPQRIKNKSLQAHSDWIQGRLLGECLSLHTLNELEFEFSSECNWKVNQKIAFSHCHVPHYGWVESIKGKKVGVHLNSPSNALDIEYPLSGMILSNKPFVWYLAKGKSSQTSLWRTPLDSGNSLELWSGIKYLAVYPMLDTNMDGILDELSTEYGSFSVDSIRAFWVESLVTYENCKPDKNNPVQTYKTFRGDTWVYDSRCTFLTDFIVPMNLL
jgi:hypothetical protein